MSDDTDYVVKFVRLNNGDDIIAQIVEVGDDEQIDYMVFNPLKVVYMSSDRGPAYLQVAFIPWVFTRICEEQEFLIHAEDVVIMANVTPMMSDYYWNNMDLFTAIKEEHVEEEIEPESQLTELETIIEAIKNTKRTFH